MVRIFSCSESCLMFSVSNASRLRKTTGCTHRKVAWERVRVIPRRRVVILGMVCFSQVVWIAASTPLSVVSGVSRRTHHDLFRPAFGSVFFSFGWPLIHLLCSLNVSLFCSSVCCLQCFALSLLLCVGAGPAPPGPNGNCGRLFV